MELRHLRYFIAVAEEHGFAAAARRLNVAQAAVSRQIADLEAEVGHRLLARNARGTHVTDAGAAFLEGARATIAAGREAIDRARSVAIGEVGHLRIGFNPTVSWHGIIPDSVRAFRRDHPRVRLTMLPMASLEQLDELLKGRLDAGFLYARPAWEWRLEGMAVLEEPLMLAVPADDPLAGGDDVVALAALAGRDLVWCQRSVSPAYHDAVVAALSRADASPRAIIETTDTSAMLALVNAGQGYSFAPASTRWRKPVGIVLKPIDQPGLDQCLELVWPTASTVPALVPWIACVRSLVAGG